MYDGVFNSVFGQGIFIKLLASVDIKPETYNSYLIPYI